MLKRICATAAITAVAALGAALPAAAEGVSTASAELSGWQVDTATVTSAAGTDQSGSSAPGTMAAGWSWQ